MDKRSGPDIVSEATRDYAARREEFRRAASRSAGESPALEATLATISEEVTAEAIERRQTRKRPL